MTLSSKFKSIFGRKKTENQQGSGKVKAFFSQLSRGLMIPIAILPIAGLLLGIGGAIGANTNSAAGTFFANVFKGMSEVVFANLAILFCVAITITFSKDKGTAGFMSALAYLVFCSSQLAFFTFDADGTITKVFWFHKVAWKEAGSDVWSKLGITTSTLGLQTLQTSIFGGIVVGGLTSLIYNKFSTVKLPTALDFFSGIRLVPFVLIPAMFGVALVFCLFWPWIGQAIYFLGSGIQKAPGGTGGLLYGILGRALMPFGLHHIPIILAFQTEFGGVLEWKTVEKALSGSDLETVKQAWLSFTKIGADKLTESKIIGDQNIWNFINSIPLNKIASIPVYEWFYKNTGAYAGRFTQDYPTYLGACMGVGAAIILASSKENRKLAATTIGSSMLVAFLTGITEPLEFSFLFCAPLLYYLVYVPFSGFSYMFMELFGAHVGVGFARGFIDLLIYGALPVAKGTNFYWAFVLAIIEGAAIFGIFYVCILKFNIPTPGRAGNPITLITKKDYNEMKSKGASAGGSNDAKVQEIIKYLGSMENIQDVTACATRLRVTLKDPNLVQKDEFAKTGSKGVILKGNGIQVIYGGEASIIADKINDIKGN